VGWAGHVSRMGEKINLYELLVNEDKLRLERPERRCEDNIQLDLKLCARVCIVVMWLKVGTSCGLLSTWY
jgi:hypothetical protein